MPIFLWQKIISFVQLLILGATGRTGKHLLAAALQDGHTVHALVRNRQKLTAHGNLKIFEGDAADENTVLKAAHGCEAILSVLNISRTSDFPWAPLRTPPHFLSTVTHHLIAAAQKESIARIVVCSAWGAAETKKDVPFWFRWFINNSNIGVAYTDHERAELLLQASALDYTIVRPTGLTNSSKEKPVIVSVANKPRPRLTISRYTLARFMLRITEHGTYLRQTVVVSQA